jgi:cell wall-associated NlpC family hydrolase
MAPVRARAGRLLATLAAGLAATILALSPATHAWADPSVSDLEKQIDDAWNALEPIIEQYNQVHVQLTANQAKAAQLEQQLRPLQRQVDMAMSRVGDLAAHVYKVGEPSRFNALLTSGSPTQLADQLALLDQLAVNQRQQISTVEAARDRYAADKKVLDDMIAQLSVQDADLAAKKQDIETQLANLQKLRQQAYGTTSGTGSLRPAACPFEYIGGAAGVAARTACAQIGKPYVWAADGPGSFDCSGLTMYAWAAAGVKLRHFTEWQYDDTNRVSRADLHPGDLVFYYGDRHHVALYVGGNWVVHAPHPGEVVRMVNITRPGSPSGFGRPG